MRWSQRCLYCKSLFFNYYFEERFDKTPGKRRDRSRAKGVTCLHYTYSDGMDTIKEMEVDIFEDGTRNNVFLEINAQPERLDLKDTFSKEARRGWLEKRDFLNTHSLCEVLKQLKKA